MAYTTQWYLFFCLPYCLVSGHSGIRRISFEFAVNFAKISFELCAKITLGSHAQSSRHDYGLDLCEFRSAGVVKPYFMKQRSSLFVIL